MTYFILQTLLWLLATFTIGLIIGRWIKRLLCNRSSPIDNTSTVSNAPYSTSEAASYSSTADRLAIRDKVEHSTDSIGDGVSRVSSSTVAAGAAITTAAGAIHHSLTDDEEILDDRPDNGSTSSEVIAEDTTEIQHNVDSDIELPNDNSLEKLETDITVNTSSDENLDDDFQAVATNDQETVSDIESAVSDPVIDSDASHLTEGAVVAGITAAVVGTVNNGTSVELDTEDLAEGIDSELASDNTTMEELETDSTVITSSNENLDDSFETIVTDDQDIANDNESDADTDTDNNDPDSEDSDLTTEGVTLAGIATAAVGAVIADDDNTDINTSENESETRNTDDTTIRSPIAGVDARNLQVIEGIGPKMEEILHNNNVFTWKDLGSKSAEEVRGILDKYGDQYKGVEDLPSWVEQAQLATNGKVDELIDMQRGIHGVGVVSKIENKFGIKKSDEIS